MLAQPLNQQQMLGYAEAWSVAPDMSLMNDTQAPAVAQLTQAMATYSANHSSFNPTTAAQAPNDATLQGAIAAAWHP